MGKIKKMKKIVKNRLDSGGHDDSGGPDDIDECYDCGGHNDKDGHDGDGHDDIGGRDHMVVTGGHDGGHGHTVWFWSK